MDQKDNYGNGDNVKEMTKSVSNDTKTDDAAGPSAAPNADGIARDLSGFSGLFISQEQEVIKITSPKRRPRNHISFSDENSKSDVIYIGGCAIPIRKSSNESGGEVAVCQSTKRESQDNLPWQLIGTYHQLKEAKCRRLYAQAGRQYDLALFIHNGKCYVMEAWCSHMGGPLFQGQIEDYHGRCHVMCPWHSYMFDLATGKNELGLRQEVHTLKYEKGELFVRYHSELSLKPYHKDSVVSIVPDKM